MNIKNIRNNNLKDTRFNIAGDILTLVDFRQIYNYICASSTSNEELVKYIKDWKSYPALKQTTKYCINEWFEVIELEDLEPLQFIYEDLFYTKGFDGMYHGWTSAEAFALSFSTDHKPVKKIHIQEARNLIESTKFKKQILYCTNNVNKKL